MTFRPADLESGRVGPAGSVPVRPGCYRAVLPVPAMPAGDRLAAQVVTVTLSAG